jgi:hypothetical protein
MAQGTLNPEKYDHGNFQEHNNNIKTKAFLHPVHN